MMSAGFALAFAASKPIVNCAPVLAIAANTSTRSLHSRFFGFIALIEICRLTPYLFFPQSANALLQILPHLFNFPRRFRDWMRSAAAQLDRSKQIQDGLSRSEFKS